MTKRQWCILFSLMSNYPCSTTPGGSVLLWIASNSIRLSRQHRPHNQRYLQESQKEHTIVFVFSQKKRKPMNDTSLSHNIEKLCVWLGNVFSSYEHRNFSIMHSAQKHVIFTLVVLRNGSATAWISVAVFFLFFTFWVLFRFVPESCITSPREFSNLRPRN